MTPSVQVGKKLAIVGKAELTRNQVLYLIGGLALAGACLRFFGLEAQSLWFDELFSWLQSNQDSLGKALAQAARDTHPPAHPLILYFVERYLGDSEFWLRLPSAVFGVLAIPAMYVLGRRMFSSTEGLWAAAFTALLWLPIYYSQEARGYSLLFLLSTLSMVFWIPLFRAQTAGADSSAFGWRDGIGYVLSAAAMIYTHHYGSLLVALQCLASVFPCGARLRAYGRALLLYLPLIVLALPVIVQASRQYSRHHLWWLDQPALETFTQAYYNFFNRSEILKHAALIVSIAPLFRLARHAWNNKSLAGFTFGANKEVWILVLWLALPWAIGAAATSMLKPMLAFRYLIVSAPAAYLLLARSLTVLSRERKVMLGVGGLLLLLALWDLFAVKQYYWKPTKQQWREAVACVVEENPHHANTLVVGCVYKPQWADYYFKRMGSDLRVQVSGGWCQKSDLPRVRGEIEKAAPRAVWLIYAHHEIEKEFLDYFTANYRQILHRPFLKAGVWLFAAE